MGVARLLPSLLQVGREVDLRNWNAGVEERVEVVGDNDNGREEEGRGSDKRRRETTEYDRTGKRQRAQNSMDSSLSDNGEQASRERRGGGESSLDVRSNTKKCQRRRLRLGVDASGWIARACHGHGGELLDERQFTNYGRAELMHQQQEAAVSLDGKLEQDFVARAAAHVVNRLVALRDVCDADVLAVLDGATPPAKEQVVRQRRQQRALAAHHAHDNDESPDEQEDDERTEGDLREERRQSRYRAAKRAGAKSSKLHEKVIAVVLHNIRQEAAALQDQQKNADNSPLLAVMVAPYESDGQLAYLSRRGLVDVVVSDDSDLVGYAVPRCLYRLRIHIDPSLTTCTPTSTPRTDENNKASPCVLGATGVLLRRVDYGNDYCLHGTAGQNQSPDETASAPRLHLDLRDFSDVMLAALCVAAGCDYCPSLRGIGPSKARDAIAEAFHLAVFESADGHRVEPNDPKGRRVPILRRLFDGLYARAYKSPFPHLGSDTHKGDQKEDETGRENNGVEADKDGKEKTEDQQRAQYEDTFLRALLMYRHPVVYDPVSRQCIVENGSWRDPDLMEYDAYRLLRNNTLRMHQEAIGTLVVAPTSLQHIVDGWVNPRTGRPYGVEENDDKPDPSLPPLPQAVVEYCRKQRTTTASTIPNCSASPRKEMPVEARERLKDPSMTGRSSSKDERRVRPGRSAAFRVRAEEGPLGSDKARAREEKKGSIV